MAFYGREKRIIIDYLYYALRISSDERLEEIKLIIIEHLTSVERKIVSEVANDLLVMIDSILEARLILKIIKHDRRSKTK